LSDKKYKLNAMYGDKDSIIVDMNGIDNFRFAKALEFRDDIIRKIVLKLNILQKNSQYLRFGCSGADESPWHPGGEVFEEMLLSSDDGSGIAQSVSGYIPKDEEYSKSIPLYDKDKIHLNEERIVYSHTAWLKHCKLEDSTSIYMQIYPNYDNIDLLDLIIDIAKQLHLQAYAIQINISKDKIDNNNIQVNGRVLKHKPKRAFNVLQEATEIGLEKQFNISPNSEFYGVGTHYLRYEPEWTEFTNGHQYERRGHIHATIVGNTSNNKVHEVFHLRDIYLSRNTNIQLVLTPISTVYRIYQVYKKENQYYTKSCDKNIDDIITAIKI